MKFWKIGGKTLSGSKDQSKYFMALYPPQHRSYIKSYTKVRISIKKPFYFWISLILCAENLPNKILGAVILICMNIW